MNSPAQQNATYRSRYECKYLVDPATAHGVRGFLRQFTRPDRFASGQPGNRYAVSSLYLDSKDLLLYAQTVAGEMDRFKLRVRTYNDDPASPAFFEVKKKINSVIYKKRAGLTRRQAHALLDLDSVAFLEELPKDVQEDLDYFRRYVTATRAKPVARVKYMREAYEALSNEPIRLTFDTDLMYATTRDGNLNHQGDDWVRAPAGGVIFEIKFTERLPGWAQELVRLFGLNQRAVPKYVLSIDHMRVHDTASPHVVAAMGG